MFTGIQCVGQTNTLSMETCLDTGRGPSHSHLYSFKTTKEYMLITSSMLDPHGTIYMIWLISRRICHRLSPGLNPSMANLGITCMYVVCRPYFKPVLKYFWLIDCLLLILVFFSRDLITYLLRQLLLIAVQRWRVQCKLTFLKR